MGDPPEIVGRRNGRAAAVVDERDAPPLDLANVPVLADAHVRPVHEQAVAVVGDVRCHGAKARVSREGEAGEAAEVEVVSVDFDKVVLEHAGQFVGAEGGGQEGIARAKALLGYLGNYSFY